MSDYSPSAKAAEPDANLPKPDSQVLLAASQCLLDWLALTPSDEKNHRILKGMATETAKKLKHGGDLPGLTADEVYAAAGEVDESKDAKKWLDWDSLQRYWKARAEAARVFANDRGLDCFLVPRKTESKGGRGVKTSYFLAIDKLVSQHPAAETAEKGTELLIRYTRSARGEVKPAFWVRWLFRGGEFEFGSPRGWFVFGWLFLLAMLTPVLSWLAIASLQAQRPVTTQTLGVLLTAAIVTVLVWREVLTPWFKLLEDRIGVTELLTAVSEKPAQLELYRQGERRHVRLVRYASTCSLCGATVYVEKGEPDFPRRLVGRCAESPREHVFRFDRVSLVGKPLLS